jgi:serine/threonine-protein kinase
MIQKRYTILKSLGSGAFATVYLAHDEKLNRDVAIKIFHNQAIKSALIRFEREAFICTKLRHPNIIRIFDASINNEQPKIIMEYIDAGDLEELMKSRSLSIEESLSIISDIGSALEYLHEKNILHRDIKPANIMIKEPLKAILMDFNLAFSEEYTMLTEEGYTVGTPKYMAPELFWGMPASEKSDIFSLGLILSELLSEGKIPGAKISIEKLTSRIIEAPSFSNIKVSGKLDRLVLWATANNVDDRCPSMSEFLRLLREIRSDDPLIDGVNKSVKGKDNRQPKIEVISIQDKGAALAESPPAAEKAPLNTKEGPSKTKRTIGAAIAFLACLFVLLHSKFSVPSEVNLKDTNLSDEDSHLLDLAVKCDRKPLSFDNLNLFVREEKSLFSKKKGALILLDGHCNSLRSILDKIETGTPFSCFVESRYRLRQGTAMDEASSENLKNKSTELLIKSNELYREELKKTDSPEPQDLTTANLILFELWQQIKSDKELADKITEETMNDFSELSESTRRTNEGKAFFHSLVLCKLLIDRKSVPEDGTLFLLKTPYDSQYLRTLRLDLINRLDLIEKQSPLVSFEEACHTLQTTCLSFLQEIRMKKDALKLAEPKNNPLGFLTPDINMAADWEINFRSLMENYVEHMNQAWFILNLAEDRSQWDIFLMMAIRDCMKYSWYGSHPTFSRLLEKMGKLNPVSQDFKETYSKIWKKAALTHVQNGQWTNLGFTAYNFSLIIRDVASLNDPQLEVRFYDFTKEISRISKETGLTLRILASIEIHTAPPSQEEIREAFNNLLKLESGIKVQDFGGWATLMCIVSNNLFINLKEENKNEERAILAMTLLKKITKYLKNGKFIVAKTLEADYENIKQSTLIHCCDAYLANGGNFLNDEKELSKELSAVEVLKLLEKNQSEDPFGGGGIGTHKILENQILNIEDFALNPLRYKLNVK